MSLKLLQSSLSLVIALCAFAAHGFSADAKRPNIILIFADDLGWKDVGFNGSDFHETPNIDRMAKEGMVFHQAYASAGNCAPSRACLLSGNYTPRHHVYAVGSTDRGPKASQRLVPIPNRNGLAKDNLTLADALKAAGYATGHFGKWHLAGRGGARPTEQGFDVSFDSFGEGELPEGSEGNKQGPPSDPKGVFTLTNKALEFIRANQSRPFFCYLAHHAIHSPLQARPETLAHFSKKKPGAQHSDAMYAACTYDLDASVALLLQKLKEMNLDQNTLVIFTSDNGGVQKSSQEPLRGSKGGYYDGGIREPFVARWPGVIKAGSESQIPIINVDLFPTFLAAAGTGAPTGKTLDGENLLPILKGEQDATKRAAIFWHFPGYLDKPVVRGRESDVRLGFRSRPVSVIRKGDWKLHLFHEEWQLDGGRAKLDANHAVELYNLKNDPGERQDLTAKNKSKRDELLDDLLAWIQETDALLPTGKNTAYEVNASTPTGGKGKRGKQKRGAGQ
jgi:arylsulfatase A-like enzyme